MNNNDFLDALIAELQAMKEDPEKDTVARVIAAVLRISAQQKRSVNFNKSLMEFAMGLDGISKEEEDILRELNK